MLHYQGKEIKVSATKGVKKVKSGDMETRKKSRDMKTRQSTRGKTAKTEGM